MNRSDQFALLRGLFLDSGTAKAILRCIHDHAGTGSCWASLTTLARESCFARRTVIRAIAELEQSGYVTAMRRDGMATHYQIDWERVRSNQLASDRESPVTESHQCQRVTGPVTESHGTSDRESPETNSKPKRNPKRTRNRHTFRKPTLEEISLYVREKSLTVDPKMFFDYFDAGDWHDSTGKPVKSWKQKLLMWNTKPSATTQTQTPKDTRKYQKAVANV